ncbi:IspD/TarI family cytidylyltransferase [Brevibacterium spongiae]|uniref:2-C-methyl-D-erythritol 4-phosphate cytidylyltransferase n=1 Tax=Brevibacterium spongiae TaxID=2909672 RepID=A0ABY5SLX1_9MICO|nr:2-C-methyl-D-erythritol 4-phosphate cytidylyltransferase [Brevibacterium spongiae]UVI35503.1 2-C-methyl-D-erythritol 4-phosphate cytidylyltransferase [Brevibacterium spongiae]
MGSRLGGGEPKAFAYVHGRSILTRSLETIISSGVASTIVVAAPEDFLFRAREEIDAVTKKWECEISITAVAGGSDRAESVQIALKHIGDAEYVLIHDAARCLTPPEVFVRVVAAVRSGAEAVVPVLPMIDTVRRAVADPAVGAEPEVLRGDLDRSLLRRVQTPQGFRAATLVRAHAQHRVDGEPATDDAGLVERLGTDVVAVDGHEEALKITYPFDLILGEQLARMHDEMDACKAARDADGAGSDARTDDRGAPR